MTHASNAVRAGIGPKPLTLLVRSLVLFVLLPNLAIAIAGRVFHGDRPFVDVDYLAAGLVALTLPTAFGVAALALAIIFDLLGTFAGIYHFDPANVLESLGELFQVNVAFLGPVIILGTAVACFLGWLCVRAVRLASPRDRRRTALALAGVGCLLAGADIMNGTTQWTNQGRALISANLVTSQGRIAGLALVDSYQRQKHRPAEGSFPHIMAATDDLRAGLASIPVPAATSAVRASMTTDSDVLLVIVESLGQSLDTSLTQAVLAPLHQASIRARYDVRSGTVGFDGATSFGEFRELCGESRDFRNAPRDTLRHCLPAMFRARGYRTIAFHGYRNRFYDRKSWYPLVGFDETLFTPELSRAGASDMCGTIFVGQCDDGVAQLVADSLTASRPRGERRFVYWLTLSSHFPIDGASSRKSTLRCSSLPESARDDDVCNLARLWYGASESIARVASDRRLHPTRIVVVGDHSPPFAREQHRALFSSSVVPFLELIPRTSPGEAGASLVAAHEMPVIPPPQ